MHEYSDKLIPQSHPVSKYVQKIAERIVSSAGLGHVKGYSPSPSSSSPFAIFGGDDVFDPDSTKFSGTSGGKDESVAINDEWEVYVINDDKTMNAFVLPGVFEIKPIFVAQFWTDGRLSSLHHRSVGGKIFVFTGILPVAKTEDGLASVMGHGSSLPLFLSFLPKSHSSSAPQNTNKTEIAHAVARHGGERMSSSKVLFALVILLELLGLDFGTGLNRLGLSLFLTWVSTFPRSKRKRLEDEEWTRLTYVYFLGIGYRTLGHRNRKVKASRNIKSKFERSYWWFRHLILSGRYRPNTYVESMLRPSRSSTVRLFLLPFISIYSSISSMPLSRPSIVSWPTLFLFLE